MSEFASDGFADYPNLHLDRQEVWGVAEWDRARLDYKSKQYGEFIQRPNLMPAHHKAAEYILDRLTFDSACRDGVYDEVLWDKLKDEVCDGI